MNSPYYITGPACISFSGGRTSGMMLHRILEAHGGTLPEDVHVLFQNTGKERHETLDFIHRCGAEWSVPIRWLEWRLPESGKGNAYVEVSHNSASHNGEPFDALIAKRGYLPNQVTRFCTTTLKIHTGRAFMLDQGYKRYTNVIGLRGDEGHRVARVRVRCASGKDGWDVAVPLYEAGVTVGEVMNFWSRQPFDLDLKQHEGNCDLCFLKSRAKIRAIMYDRPELAEWWIAKERETGATFRPPDRPDYAALFATRRKQTEMFDMDALDLECACTD